MYLATYQGAPETANGLFWLSNTNFIQAPPAGSTFGGAELHAEASRCSSIYGAQDTVMPASADLSMGLYLGSLA